MIRQKAYIQSYTNFIFVLKNLEVTAHGHRKNETSDMFADGSDLSSKARASSICNAICTYLSDNTIKLQGSATEILQAFNEKFQGNAKITKALNRPTVSHYLCICSINGRKSKCPTKYTSNMP